MNVRKNAIESKNKELLKVERLTYSHKGKAHAVKDLSFSLQAGQILGLAGGSGAGKSTLCNLLIGMLKPDQGRVSYLGQDTYQLRKRGLLNSEIQMVLQNPETAFNPVRTMAYSLLELRHFSDLTSDEIRKEIEYWLPEFELSKDMLSRRPDDLSGGQLQRFSILRALLLKPKILILDEVTSMLDSLVQARIIQILQRLKVELDLSYIFVSHDIYLMASFASQVLIIKDGRAVWQGNVDRITESSYAKDLIQDQKLILGELA